MRSRHDKRRRSRISPIDRLIQTSAGSALVAVVKSNSLSRPSQNLNPSPEDLIQASDRQPPVVKSLRRQKMLGDSQVAQPSLVSSEVLLEEAPPIVLPQRKNIFKRIIHRLQYPVGWRPVIVLILTWILMMGVIWGAFKEIMSLGASPAKQTIAQIERKSLLELLGALCLGGIGLSLALTPALKRPPRHNPEPLQASLENEELRMKN
jgi:hypothetical protein